jgi:hypothetical protein
MTPYSKAIELVGNLLCYTKDIDLVLSKKFALISVEEILNIKLLWYQKDTKELDYWKEVKKEIEKI